jgi:hypothetical protein
MKKQNRALIIPFIIISLLCIFLLYIIGRPFSYIWVMDAGGSLNQTHLAKICPSGARLSQTQFGQSAEIGIDGDENILWAPELNDLDNINYNQVVQVDSEANVINRFQGYRIDVLAVDPSDGSVWVNTWNAEEQRTLMTKLSANGKLLRSVGEFHLVSAIALDTRDSSIWVADYGDRILTQLSKDGEKLFETRVEGHFFSNAPDQITVEPQNGDVWFTTFDPSQLHKLSAKGEMLIEKGGFRSPVAVAINPISGNVWVADYDLLGSGAIVKLDSSGHILLTQTLPAHAHTAAINPFDGTLWVGVDGEVIRYYEDGSVAEREAGFNRPQSFAFAKSGNDLRTKIKCTLDFYSDMLK